MSICVYLKFYETKIHLLKEKWLDFIYKLIKHNDNENSKITIYIWVETKWSVKQVIDVLKCDYIKDNLDTIHIITHDNKKKYVPDINKYESYIQNWFFLPCYGPFPNDKVDLFTTFIKSFVLPKEDYIVNIDADYMFFDDLNPVDLLRAVDYMKKENIEIMSRPFWCFSPYTDPEQWSFGFTIQKKTFFEKIHLDKRDTYPYKGKNWETIACIDNLVHNIIKYELKLTNKQKFFYFKNMPFWIDCTSTDDRIRFYLNPNNLQNFCGKYDIQGV